MDPVRVELEPYRLGDKWVGMTIGPVTISYDGDPAIQPINQLGKIRCHFVRRGAPTFTLSSDPSENPDQLITINDVDTWEAFVPEVPEFVQKSGSWNWDMEFFEDGDETPQTFYFGELKVSEDITKR